MKRICAMGILVGLCMWAGTVSAETDIEGLTRQVSVLSRALEELSLLRGDQSIAPVGYQPLEVAEMQEVLERGATWLASAQEPSGHFRYEYLPYDDDYRNDDNIVRQAGAFFELGEIERLDKDEYDFEETLIRSADYFENLSRDGKNGGATFRCIVDDESGRTCKLGATALALVGLIDLVTEYPEHEKRYAPLILDYAAYIREAKKDGAGFRYYYHIGNGFTREDESSFSNGEALLALVRHYQYEKNGDTKRVIDDTFAYLKDTPFDTALYLWAMAALKDMNVLWPHAEYLSYAQAYTDWRIKDFTYRKRTSHNMCAYTEGVVSAYILLRDSLDPGRKAHYVNDIRYWLWKNAQLQLTDADIDKLVFDGTTPRIATLPEPSRAIGGFFTGHDALTQRIDFTQHCLSTYLQTLSEIEHAPLR